MTHTFKLSVVIATYNRCDILSRTLPTVFEQNFPTDEYEVIVVVDGSTDGTVEMLRRLRPACALQVIEQSNQGQAAARNAGMKAARGELILLLDDDLFCDRELVGEHVAAHTTRSGSEPLLILGWGRMSAESPNNLATDRARKDYTEYYGRLSGGIEPQWPYDAYTPWNCSARRLTLLASGGFDERFRYAREDHDLGMRLWKMGVRFRYLHTAVAYQLYVKTRRDLLRTDSKWYARSELLLCRKHPEYRCYSWLASLGEGSLWRRLFRQAVIRSPVSLEPFLGLPLWMAERLRSIPEVRRRGLWLLQYQLAIVRFREALRSAKSWKALNAEFGMRLPVLMYHHVGPQRPGTYPGLTVSPRRFERQVRWLASRGYAGISPTDWLRWRREGKSLPEKPVLLTFDDAYSDIADYALPVLRQHRFGASVFVVTSQVGGTNTWDEARGSGPHRLMTGDQIRYWAAQGIEFGAHGRTHADLTKLTGAELTEEVAGSANDLASILGSRVSSFAYPYGSQNQTVRDCVRSVFDLAFSTAEGLNSLQTDPLSLRRTMIGNGDTLMDLECRLRWGWSPMQRLRARARLRSRLQRAANLVYGGNG